jgi:hypothetical protein
MVVLILINACKKYIFSSFSVGIPALQACRILYRAQFAKSKNGRKIPFSFFSIAKKRQELTTDP